jgi:Putative beta-barrel porin-2, OmpL-like. bbp2
MNWSIKLLWYSLPFAQAFFCRAQILNTATMDTLETTVLGNIAVGGMVDTYFGYQLNEPFSETVDYFVSSNRHNEFNINLAYIDVRYRSNVLRARFAPGFGTYMNSNYANEPGTLKNIVEANVGVALWKKKKIWVDVGVFGSPYTNESAISKDHLMYTRSFAPENVPYYLAGIKASVALHQKVNLYLYVMNGWQVITDNNSGKSIGTQVEIRPNKNLLLNWNTYIGDERNQQRPEFRTRYFSDFYLIGKVNDKIDVTSCFYIGAQKRLGFADGVWWQVNAIGRYHFTSKISLSGRLEYFHDPSNIFQSNVVAPLEFNVGSGGLCLNVNVTDRALFRVEARQFFSSRDSFAGSKGDTNGNLWLTGSLAVWF